MCISDKLWIMFLTNNPKFKDWSIFFNKYAEDGSILDEDDNTSFINPEKTKAIKIMFEKNGSFLFDSWHSLFGEQESGTVDVLNVIFNDIDKSYPAFEKTFLEWVNS